MAFTIGSSPNAFSDFLRVSVPVLALGLALPARKPLVSSPPLRLIQGGLRRPSLLWRLFSRVPVLPPVFALGALGVGAWIMLGRKPITPRELVWALDPTVDPPDFETAPDHQKTRKCIDAFLASERPEIAHMVYDARRIMTSYGNAQGVLQTIQKSDWPLEFERTLSSIFDLFDRRPIGLRTLKTWLEGFCVDMMNLGNFWLLDCIKNSWDPKNGDLRNLRQMEREFPVVRDRLREVSADLEGVMGQVRLGHYNGFGKPHLNYDPRRLELLTQKYGIDRKVLFSKAALNLPPPP